MNSHHQKYKIAKRVLGGFYARRGAALTEYIVMGMLIGVFSIGMVSAFGDNIRTVFSSADNSLAGVDSVPRSESAKPGSYTLKGLKSDRFSGEEAGRLAAMNSALQAALNDPKAIRISSEGFTQREPGDHPMYPGQRFDGYRATKAGLGLIPIVVGVIGGTAVLTDYGLTKWFNSMLLEKVKKLESEIESLRGQKQSPGRDAVQLPGRSSRDSEDPRGI